MRKVRIGIIGAGRIGKLHAENQVRNGQVQIAGIADPFAAQMEEWAAKLGISKVISEPLELIQDPEVDAIFICSPTTTHAQLIIEAAKAKKHIFCEKPISFDPEQTREALRVVEAAGVKFQTGFNRRFDRNFKHVAQAIRAGKIGDTHIVKITSRDPDAPPKPYILHSGGLFMDMSIHDFDMARYLTGAEVEEVYVQGAVLVDPVFEECGDIDTALVTLKFSNGALGVIDNSRRAVYGYDQRVEVFGSGGAISVQNEFPNSAELMTSEGIYRDKPHYFFLDRYNQAYVEETNQFIECILEDKPVAVNGYDGLAAELIARACDKSYRERRPVKLSEL
ncbi:inositol 2-dehydrogenase [Brevibacillus nitrificans]|uniref:inositol 2-dehydrogenase n=1 Tax=Brevibacillus nitrificans TaxID=651560 RepID=UPI002857B91E|nr:inositol 2-dehydrogenase [Brevibacillus nitrificans]MDR7315522.1 myo-inositol 2-dehydrogenase/D-chiro-inositol 1-dehydrogenase [Brevibacillus nitrificans]